MIAELAKEITETLFVDGCGVRAERLVHYIDSTNTIRGGWSEIAARHHLELMLRKSPSMADCHSASAYLSELRAKVRELHQAEDELEHASGDGAAHFRKTIEKIRVIQKALREMVPTESEVQGE